MKNQIEQFKFVPVNYSTKGLLAEVSMVVNTTWYIKRVRCGFIAFSPFSFCSLFVIMVNVIFFEIGHSFIYSVWLIWSKSKKYI